MEAIALILVLLGGGVAVTALLVVLHALFPHAVSRTAHTAATMPWRSLGAGAINALFLGAIGLAIIALGDAAGLDVVTLLGLLVLCVLAILATVGLSGVAVLLGRRLAPDHAGTARDVRGAGALVLAALAPFVGWFALLPFALLLGLGGLILGTLAPPRQPAPASAELADLT